MKAGFAIIVDASFMRDEANADKHFFNQKYRYDKPALAVLLWFSSTSTVVEPELLTTEEDDVLVDSSSDTEGCNDKGCTPRILGTTDFDENC